tara:strand:- start:53 stop:409 length:357 start_codon:yes stop_codon:yes gene_type:complete
MTEVIRGGRKVEWVDIGEGWSGDYNPDDPEDVALLRFDVLELTKVDGLFSDSPELEWEVLDDASYCTQMPADTSEADLRRAAEIIMDATYGQTNIKKICEELSWISPGWLEQPELKRF